jgi:hypothetical protein
MDKKNMISNSNLESKQSNTDARALWTPRFTTVFCEVCVDEVFQDNRLNFHFTRQCWKNMLA